MANKTIHELTPASTVSSDYEFAVYDIDGSTTKKATAEQVLGTSPLLYADDQEEPTGEVSFVSQDTMLTPAATDTLSVELLQGTDTWGARFQKISQMFRNIRYLLRTMGTTDISSIGNGTVTGIITGHENSIDALNNKVINIPTIPANADLNNYRGLALTGFYYLNGAQVANSPYPYGGLIVNANYQMIIAKNALYFRGYSGSPAAWGDWHTVSFT